MGLGMSLLMTLIITFVNTGYDEFYIKRFLKDLVYKFTGGNDYNDYSGSYSTKICR